MSLDFGKLNFSISFNPTSAFPIDARSYFESYAEAVRAAAGAKPVGSTDSIYYFGQTIVVVENEKANFYIIQPDHTLSAITGISSIPVNSKLFETDSAGNLSLKGFDSAAADSVFSVGDDGSLKWISIYTKDEIDAAIKAATAKASHMKRKIVASEEEILSYAGHNNDAETYIFMIPSGSVEAADKYHEYIVVVFENPEGETVTSVERIGSWEVNLEDYLSKTEASKLFNEKVDKIDGARLMTDSEGAKLQSLLAIKSINGTLSIDPAGSLGVKEIEASQVRDLSSWITSHANVVKGLSEENFTTQLSTKLASIQAGAEKNFIRSTSNEFEVTEEGQLTIKSITSAKISDLTKLLEEKANADFVIQLAENVDGLSSDVTDLKSRMTWKQI